MDYGWSIYAHLQETKNHGWTAWSQQKHPKLISSNQKTLRDQYELFWDDSSHFFQGFFFQIFWVSKQFPKLHISWRLAYHSPQGSQRQSTGPRPSQTVAPQGSTWKQWSPEGWLAQWKWSDQMFGHRFAKCFFGGMEGQLSRLLSVCHVDCFVWKMIRSLNSLWMGELFRLAKKNVATGKAPELLMTLAACVSGTLMWTLETSSYQRRCLILVEDGRFHGWLTKSLCGSITFYQKQKS